MCGGKPTEACLEAMLYLWSSINTLPKAAFSVPTLYYKKLSIVAILCHMLGWRVIGLKLALCEDVVSLYHPLVP